jgi:Co/Zn/Cd efflux system component
MAGCCDEKSCALEVLHERQSATLKIVLIINAVMFLFELASGVFARSTALVSDSLDNLGDAMTYGLSLNAVRRTPQAKAKVALFKGGLILLAAAFVLTQVAYRVAVPTYPMFEAMGAVSILALLANSACLALLWKHRREDVNMSSVWECSRNDIASNVAVFLAAGAVWLLDSRWPDLVVGLALATLFMCSGLRVLRNALPLLAAQEPRTSVAGTGPNRS